MQTKRKDYHAVSSMSDRVSERPETQLHACYRDLNTGVSSTLLDDENEHLRLVTQYCNGI